MQTKNNQAKYYKQKCCLFDGGQRYITYPTQTVNNTDSFKLSWKTRLRSQSKATGTHLVIYLSEEKLIASFSGTQAQFITLKGQTGFAYQCIVEYTGDPTGTNNFKGTLINIETGETKVEYQTVDLSAVASSDFYVIGSQATNYHYASGPLWEFKFWKNDVLLYDLPLENDANNIATDGPVLSTAFNLNFGEITLAETNTDVACIVKSSCFQGDGTQAYASLGKKVLAGASTFEMECKAFGPGSAIEQIIMAEGWTGVNGFKVGDGTYYNLFFLNRIGGVDYEFKADYFLDEVRHLKTTYDGTKLRYFINGDQVGENDATGTVDDTDGWLAIGALHQAGQNNRSMFYRDRVWDVKVKVNNVLVVDMPLNGSIINLAGETPDTAASYCTAPGKQSFNLSTSISLTYGESIDIDKENGNYYFQDAPNHYWGTSSSYTLELDPTNKTVKHTITADGAGIYITNYFYGAYIKGTFNKMRYKMEYRTNSNMSNTFDIMTGTYSNKLHLAAADDWTPIESTGYFKGDYYSAYSFRIQFNKLAEGDWVEFRNIELNLLEQPKRNDGTYLFPIKPETETAPGYWNNNTDFYVRFTNSFWDKSNTAIWDSSIQALETYDSDNPTDWKSTELNKDFFAKYLQSAFRDRVFEADNKWLYIRPYITDEATGEYIFGDSGENLFKTQNILQYDEQQTGKTLLRIVKWIDTKGNVK